MIKWAVVAKNSGGGDDSKAELPSKGEGEKEGEAIGRGLEKNATLTTLGLWGNRLGEKGGAAALEPLSEQGPGPRPPGWQPYPCQWPPSQWSQPGWPARTQR